MPDRLLAAPPVSPALTGSAARSLGESVPEGFGFGCSLEEHVRFGQCLDGLCSTRANWESVAASEASNRAKLARTGAKVGASVTGGSG